MEATETPSEVPDYLLYQAFQSSDGEPLASLPTLVCHDSGERYTLWSDIQKTFEAMDHLKNWRGRRSLFMIDRAGDLCLPLRILCDQGDVYTVIHNNLSLSGHPDHSPQYMARDHTDEDSELDDSQGEHKARVPLTGSRLLPISRLFEAYEDLHRQLHTELENFAQRERDFFQQAAANVQYYHSKILSEIDLLDSTGINILVGGKDRDQILQELHEREQQAQDCIYRYNCMGIVRDTGMKWDSAVPGLFIVLPSNLDDWDKSDPSTHTFRLYFMCDADDYLTMNGLPVHIHFSNHQGYNLHRPQEFFQAYGGYVLRVLHMVKRGHFWSGDIYKVPVLDTFQILWRCDPNVLGSDLSTDMIGSLVDKAITYLQDFSPANSVLQFGLTRAHRFKIKTYLDAQDGDSAQGGLFQCIDGNQHVKRRCEGHAFQFADQAALEALKDFVNGHGGQVKMQQAILHVELESESEAGQFLTLLTATKHTFNISIKLSWTATRSYLEVIFIRIGYTNVVTLEIDGITCNIHPQDSAQYPVDLFADRVMSQTNVRLITLLNYPRPQEQYIYTGGCSLHLGHSPTRPTCDWVELQESVDNFRTTVFNTGDKSTLIMASSVLRNALSVQGFPDVTTITIHHDLWSGAFDLKDGAFVEVCSIGADWPLEIGSLGSLRRLTVHHLEPEFDHAFYCAVQDSGLQELNVSVQGRGGLEYAVQIAKMWCNISPLLRLTLFDRAEDTRGWIVVQLVVSEHNSNHHERERFNGVNESKSSVSQAPDMPPEIEFLQWNYDHISFQAFDDYSASLIDMATLQHPSVLSSFTLDISHLSPVGIVSMQHVFRQSRFEVLRALCPPIDPSLSSSIAQVLLAVQWSTLKSLELIGDDIDSWTQLWATHSNLLHAGAFDFNHELLCLHIQGTGSTPQLLAHSSCLFIHVLIYASPLVEVHLENVKAQDEHDWDLIKGPVDHCLLEIMPLSKGLNGSQPKLANVV